MTRPSVDCRLRFRTVSSDMRAAILSCLVLAHAGLGSLASSADGGFWTDREVCRAAVKTYFFLAAKPADATGDDGYFGFRSASGNIYTCRLAGAQAIFRWANASGEPMNSSSTTFRLAGDTLTIRTDMNEERFRAE